MSGQRIDLVLVEKAAKAWFDRGREREKGQGLDAGLTWEEFVANENIEQEDFGWTLDELYEQIEAALRVVFDELGLKEERKTRRAFVGPDDVEHPDEQRVRLVSDWRSVEQGDGQ
jgi:hypothetical protein